MIKSFTTLVKNDGNDYMRGFIAGIMHTICGARMSAWIGFEDDSRMISVTCSGLQLWKTKEWKQSLENLTIYGHFADFAIYIMETIEFLNFIYFERGKLLCLKSRQLTTQKR